MHISEKKKKKKSSFRREFSSFWKKFQILVTLFFFLQISMPFLIPATDSTQPTLTITENRTDRFRFQVTPPLHSTPVGRIRVRSKIDPACPMDSPSFYVSGCMHSKCDPEKKRLYNFWSLDSQNEEPFFAPFQLLISPQARYPP